MTDYIKTGDRVQIAPPSAEFDRLLEPHNYVMKVDPMTGFYMDKIEDFQLPTKLYGDTTSMASRILQTFQERKTGTGVLLVGEKGSGKTLLTKKISMEARSLGIPTIVINTPLCGDQFNSIIQQIDQPVIVLFDEFEKVYDDDQQNMLLTLFDGVFSSKKLFLLTSNDKYRINAHMKNRPGRIYYMIEFSGLEEKFIQEYCDDNLIYKERKEEICKISQIWGNNFNFDMLKAMVEEINRYNDTVENILRVLNIKTEYVTEQNYNCEIVSPDGGIIPIPRGNETIKTRAFNSIVTMHFWYSLKKNTKNDDDEDDENQLLLKQHFCPNDIVSYTRTQIVFVNKEGYKLTLSLADRYAYAPGDF